jgi:hypothetical protein
VRQSGASPTGAAVSERSLGCVSGCGARIIALRRTSTQYPMMPRTPIDTMSEAMSLPFLKTFD